MTGNLMKLGLVLLAVLALGAIGAQGAVGADAHEFHFDGERSIITGEATTPHNITVGSAGTVECTGTTLEGTEVGIKVADNTYKTDELTVVPKTISCTFGGQPASVFMNHCAYVFDSDTTLGNPTGGGNKHANLTIECAANNKIQIHTVNCTITIGPQVVEHAVRYENDGQSAFKIITTAHGIEVGKERSTAAQPISGCLTFPTGSVGKVTGTTTNKCFKDESSAQANPTTPVGTQDATTTQCTVTDI